MGNREWGAVRSLLDGLVSGVFWQQAVATGTGRGPGQTFDYIVRLYFSGKQSKQIFQE